MLEELLSKASKALVIGVGGGGDIIGAIPTKSFLNFLGVRTVLGGITWERKVVDPKPGPRSIEELEGVEPINRYTALALPGASIKGGCTLTEGVVAEIFREKTLVLDINGGARGTLEALEEAVERLGIDLVVGIDVGGDSLARGGEAGVSSPLADGIMVSVLKNLSVPAILGVIGYGSDGELTLEELHRNIAWITSKGGYLGARGASHRELELMLACAELTPTEASKLVVEAGRGKVGEVKIREDTRALSLTPCSLITFYFKPEVVFELSEIPKLVEKSNSLREADSILRGKGYITELYFEEEE